MSNRIAISTVDKSSQVPLLQAQIIPALLRLSLPNLFAMGALVGAAIIETIYVARLGQASLAAMAIVFPIVILHTALSSGAFGGGISSAVSRSLGEKHQEAARTLARTALLACLALGSISCLAMQLLARNIVELFNTTGEVHVAALTYIRVVFSAAPIIWLTNGMISIIRGSGDMVTSSIATVAIAALQVAAGACLGLGVGPIPSLGMAGVALGQVVAYTTCGALLLAYLLFAAPAVGVRGTGGMFDRQALRRILRVGLVSCIAPIQTNLTIVVTTALLAGHGTAALAGYGVGARLEMLLVNISFAIGSASVPLVGVAVGAGDWRRAQRVCWAAGLIGGLGIGALGTVFCLWPNAWSELFPIDESMRNVANRYLTIVGPAFFFFGLGLCLFFASQGTGRVIGTVFAGTLRLALVAGIGAWLAIAGSNLSELFILVAAGMILFGAVASVATAARKE